MLINPDLPDCASIPSWYHGLKEVFNKAMKEYIQPSFQAVIFRLSLCPADSDSDSYPLPLISSAFELLQQVKIFTKLDPQNVWCQVRIREGGEWKKAFNTPDGHYEYLVMPFSLTNALVIFQALVNDVQ